MSGTLSFISMFSLGIVGVDATLMTSVVGVTSTPTIPNENIEMKDSVLDAEENSRPMETE